jgi:phospholipid transport system substrate-binding protein
MMLTPRWLGAATLAAAAALLVAPAAVSNEPRDVIAKTVDQVLAVLQDQTLSKQARLDRIVEIAYERFDVQTMSKLVLAKYWKRFDAAQREEFVKEFKDYLAHQYGDRLERYDQEKVEVTGERRTKGGDAIVFTRITRPSGAPVEVEYRLRNKAGSWRVIDVKLEGIGQVSNYRDQFRETLSRGGPEKLLAELRAKNSARTPAEPGS